jgi:cold shock CspA family protein
MVKGKIVRFENGRSYGFIAPDTGGDDVFVHASELERDGRPVSCGTVVEFKVIDGGRGPKAYDVRILPGDATDRVLNEPFTPRDLGPRDDASDEVCDVLSSRDFSHEVTDLIINRSPSTTGAQIVEIRAALAEMARRHGWVD